MDIQSKLTSNLWCYTYFLIWIFSPSNFMSVGHLWWELLWNLWYLGFPRLHHITNNHTRKPLFHQSQHWKIKLIWTTMRYFACTIFDLSWCECLNSHWNAKEINGQSKTNQINLENPYTHVNQMIQNNFITYCLIIWP